ncbi:YggS family pyridoxal phosphate-dependent enzyme [Alphaproteobacteria bacterium]|nr:YggS family pyridoxal phosphate-dependent enzyme [Alphaproteobacteria bacterium]
MFDLKNYLKIQKTINNLGKKTKIVAISKNHPVEDIQEAISKGVEVFGENRVQEAKLKFENILKNNKEIKLHLTGPLQTNKVKVALDLFSVFHTLDREKLVRELIKFPEKLTNKSFFIQVNTGNEETKSGIQPSETKAFLEMCRAKGINNILGLMCIPPVNEDPKIHFQLISKLSSDLNLAGVSIGMSSDYLDALDFNPQFIRLGTVLFGKRV